MINRGPSVAPTQRHRGAHRAPKNVRSTYIKGCKAHAYLVNKANPMTKDEFWTRFIDTTNALRLVLNEPLLTRERLERAGCLVRPCNCSDPTCPGWGMAFVKKDRVGSE